MDPRPPIQPRIYKRLYNHLEKILPSSSSTPGRQTPGRQTPGGGGSRTPGSRLRTNDVLESPTARKGAANASPLPSRVPSRVTPGKTKSLAEFRGTPATAPPPKLTSSEALPPWMRPTLRFICKEHGHDNIGPVMMSGVESIVAPGGVMTEDTWVRNNLVSLLGALYLYIWRAVKWPGEDLDEAEYVLFRKELVATLKRARQEVTLNPPASSSSGSPLKRKRPTPEEEEASWEGWHIVRAKDLDTAAVHINRHGWLELDWAKGIDDLITQAAEGGEEDGVDNDGDSVTQGPIQIRRTDTMLQERYDYLSERKKQEYEVWKEDILNRIKKLQARPPPAMTAGMDLDPDSEGS